MREKKEKDWNETISKPKEGRTKVEREMVRKIHKESEIEKYEDERRKKDKEI